jgi:hypothetical protein
VGVGTSGRALMATGRAAAMRPLSRFDSLWRHLPPSGRRFAAHHCAARPAQDCHVSQAKRIFRAVWRNFGTEKFANINACVR